MKKKATAEIDRSFAPVVEAFAKDRQITYGKMFASMGLKVNRKIKGKHEAPEEMNDSH